ncbi:hypothetical protein Tco_1296887, partial [Tanacetum coccineum]
MDHSFSSDEEVDHVRILLPQPKYYLRDDSCFFNSGVFRLAFDPRKSSHYKVVQARGEAGETWIQNYSSETRNWSFCRDRFNYFSFDHFESTIYWNDAFHWLEGLNRELKHCKLNMEDHDHPIMTSLIGKFFESCGCLLLVCKDDIGYTEFTIYEMMKGSSVWCLEYLFGRRIFDIGSNQTDDDDADDDDAVLFIPPFEVDHNLYEFIPSLASEMRISQFHNYPIPKRKASKVIFIKLPLVILRFHRPPVIGRKHLPKDAGRVKISNTNAYMNDNVSKNVNGITGG